MRRLIFLLLAGSLNAQPVVKPELLKVYNIKISEPSDISVAPDGKSLFIVSDNGALFETDLEGNIIRSTQAGLVDAEGVYADENFVYVVEERNRFIKTFSRKDFQLLNTVNIPYEGGRNKGFEGITKSPDGNWLLFTEKEPVWMFTLDEKMHEINRQKWEVPGDVSAAVWFNGFLWLLSDERAEVWKTDWKTGTILKRFKLPVLNPEGLAFSKDGKMYVLSDDGQKMYVFNDLNLLTDASK